MFQVFKTPPTVFVTVSHQSPNRSQDAMAVWVKDVGNNNFKICLRETKIFGGTHKNIKIVSELHFIISLELNKASLIWLENSLEYTLFLSGLHKIGMKK